MAVIPNYGPSNGSDPIQNSRNRNATGLNILKFPLDIDNVPHRFLMNFKKRNTTISMQDNGANINSQTDITGALILPVPKRIDEGFNVNYKSENLGIIGQAIRQIADDPQAAWDRLKSRGTDLLRGPGDLMERATRAFGNVSRADAVLGSMGIAQTIDNGDLGRLSRIAQPTAEVALGAILNPYTTAMFTGVNLRENTFSWFLAPNNEKESQEVEKIIRAIRYNMLPTASNGVVTLQYPNEVEYQLVGMQEYYQIPTKPCVIKDFKISRAPFADGGPAFFAGTGAPVFFELEITLLEVTPIIRDDLDSVGLAPQNSDYGQTTRQTNQTAPTNTTTPLIGGGG